MAETVHYRGTMAVRDHGEAMDVLFLEGADNFDEPLAETISDDLDRCGRYASVRYWTADVPLLDAAIMESAVRAGLDEARLAEAGEIIAEIKTLRAEWDTLTDGDDGGGL